MEDMRDDDRLKMQGLFFYEKDIGLIDKVLELFLKRSKAKCALLINADGILITSQGSLEYLESGDTDSLSTLIASTFSATKTWAQLLGVKQFSELHHESNEVNIFVKSIDKRALVTIIFDSDTKLGMIKLIAKELAKKLLEIFKKAEDNNMDDYFANFQEAATEGENSFHNVLDDLFG